MRPPPGLCDDELPIGPPPGIEIPAKQQNKSNKQGRRKQNFNQPSLEELNLELKITVQDQKFDQLPIGQDYLEPSMNNLLVYDGYLCDSAGSDSLGIWDNQMRLMGEYRGLVENIPCQMVSVGDKIILNFADYLFLVEPRENRKSIILEQALQAFSVSENKNPRIVGISEGQIYLWEGFFKGGNQGNTVFNQRLKGTKQNELMLLSKVSAKEEEFDEILILGNGMVFVKQRKVGEVYVVDFEEQFIEELQRTQGCAVTCWCPIQYDTVAFASNGQIMIVQYNNKAGLVKQMLETTKDDIFHGLCFTNNQLFSINKNAHVHCWNNGKKVATAEVKFCHGVYSLLGVNKDAIVALHTEKKDFVLLSTKLETLFTYKARVKQVIHCCVSPCKKIIAVVQKVGLHYDEEVAFHVEIEVYPLCQMEMTRRREVENIEMLTVQFLDSSTIQYIVKITKTVNPTLSRWNFVKNEISEKELLVERYRNCLLFQNRMAFSFQFTQGPQQTFNLFSSKREEGQQQAGISIYNVENQRLLKITFPQLFEEEIFGMANEDLFYVLNPKNQIEVWDVQKQCLLQRSDCRPNVIKSIKFSNEYLLLVAQSEWMVRDLKLGLVCKIKGQMVKKAQFNGKMCVVQVKNNLIVWDISQNITKQLNVPFSVIDFCVCRESVLVIGDSAMKQLSL